MLGHRLRRWPNIKPALDQRMMFAVECLRYFAVFFRCGLYVVYQSTFHKWLASQSLPLPAAEDYVTRSHFVVLPGFTAGGSA